MGFDHAAIDFGTSNSAIVVPSSAGVPTLVELEPGYRTMPTAVFYAAEPHEGGADRLYGRAAIDAYVEGWDGRLMRSMKSVLGSSLIGQATDVGRGQAVRYVDVIAGYLRRLKHCAERHLGNPIDRVVLGRPVYFVDDDPARDAQAQTALEAAARSVGFAEVRFQFEPIAAALDHEQRVRTEQCVLVADIGGGTSDFSVVRIGPDRRQAQERRDDILASHGVHIAGTDFDRRIELDAMMPLLGYRASGPARPGEAPREVPSAVYFDLATWHLVNTVYAPARVAELRGMLAFYGNPAHHARLMRVVEQRRGHALVAAAEQAKIGVADQGEVDIDLACAETGLAARLSAAQAAEAIEADLARVVAAADETLRRANLRGGDIDAVYFTGGSTGLRALADRIAERCPRAERVRGDRFASVAQGLGVHAARLFAARRPGPADA